MSDIDVYRSDMHVRLQICIPVNMETYLPKQLLYCLILYTCMFLFRLKRMMLQKGKSKCFSRHSRDNISGAWSQIRPAVQQRNKDMLNCQLTENKSKLLLNQLVTFCCSVGKLALLFYKLCIVSMGNVMSIQ